MIELRHWRAAARALDRFACGYEKGRAKTDPVYQLVCEGRDTPPNYLTMSTCADRAHWRLWRLGCRLPFVNREERSPLPHDWHLGVNVSNLHNIALGAPCIFQPLQTMSGTRKVAVPPSDAWVPEDCDELIIANHPLGKDAHVLSIVHYDGARAETANYGASGCSAAVFPGAKLGHAPLTFSQGSWRYGAPGHEKRVIRVLRFEDQVQTFTAKPDLEGVPFDDEYIGETRDLLELSVA